MSAHRFPPDCMARQICHICDRAEATISRGEGLPTLCKPCDSVVTSWWVRWGGMAALIVAAVLCFVGLNALAWMAGPRGR